MTERDASTLAQFLLDLIFQPGSSLKLVPVINISILCLLVVLCFTTYSKIAAIHIIVLSSLAVGLLISVNWFYYEYQKVIRERDNNDTIEGEVSGQNAKAQPNPRGVAHDAQKTD